MESSERNFVCECGCRFVSEESAVQHVEEIHAGEGGLEIEDLIERLIHPSPLTAEYSFVYEDDMSSLLPDLLTAIESSDGRWAHLSRPLLVALADREPNEILDANERRHLWRILVAVLGNRHPQVSAFTEAAREVSVGVARKIVEAIESKIPLGSLAFGAPTHLVTEEALRENDLLPSPEVFDQLPGLGDGPKQHKHFWRSRMIEALSPELYQFLVELHFDEVIIEISYTTEAEESFWAFFGDQCGVKKPAGIRPIAPKVNGFGPRGGTTDHGPVLGRVYFPEPPNWDILGQIEDGRGKSRIRESTKLDRQGKKMLAVNDVRLALKLIGDYGFPIKKYISGPMPRYREISDVQRAAVAQRGH